MDTWPPSPNVEPPKAIPPPPKLLTRWAWADGVLGLLAGVVSSVVVWLALGFITVTVIRGPAGVIAFDRIGFCSTLVIELGYGFLLRRRYSLFAEAWMISVLLMVLPLMVIGYLFGGLADALS